jgi:hypothetical protein
MEIAAAIAIATLIGPFLIGWWIGHPAFAAAAFGALGLTVFLAQLRLDDSEGPAFAWIAISTVLSAAAAYYGGQVREKRHQRRLEEKR